MRQEQEASRSDLVRGVLVIVVAGIALGLAFNGLGQAGKPPRGLAWVRQAERMERLEDLAEAAAADPGAVPVPDTSLVAGTGAQPPPAQAGSVPPPMTASPGAPSAAAPAARPAPRAGAPPVAQESAADGDGDASGDATNPGTVSSPAAATALPTIPVVDHPLEVDLATFKKFFDAGGAAIVDARDPEEYTSGHVAGARNIPFDDLFSDPSLLERFDPRDRPIICYCSGPGCDLSMQLARSLIDAGFKRVLVFEAGFPAWEGAGYPVVRGAEPGVGG